MNENLLITASRLSDEALLARVKLLAGRERVASVELIAHLAELDTRDVYLGKGVRPLPLLHADPPPVRACRVQPHCGRASGADVPGDP